MKEVRSGEVCKRKAGTKERTEEIKSNQEIATLVNTAQSFGWYSRASFVLWFVRFSDNVSTTLHIEV